MKINIPFNQTDAVVLFFLLILFIIGVRVVIGFFKTPDSHKKHRQSTETKNETDADESGFKES